MGDATFMRVKRDRLDSTTGQNCGDGMTELVKGDDKHLRWMLEVFFSPTGSLIRSPDMKGCGKRWLLIKCADLKGP